MGIQQKMKDKLDQAQDKASSAVDKAMKDMKGKSDEQAKQAGQQPQDQMQQDQMQQDQMHQDQMQQSQNKM